MESRGYAPHVTVFSMNRPERHLHRYLSLDATGRLHSGISRINPYDVWSAFSMSYNTGESRDPPPLAPPHAQLPPFPQKKSRRRITAKSPAGDLDEQVLSAAPPPGDQMQPSEGPERVSPDAAGMSTFLQEMNEEARKAHDSMVKLFLTKRCVSFVAILVQARLVHGILPFSTRWTNKLGCDVSIARFATAQVSTESYTSWKSITNCHLLTKIGSGGIMNSSWR